MSLGQQIPIADISAGLRALWEADHAKSRAALMNLVIYAEDGSSLEQIAEDAAHISESQACRALIIRGIRCEAESFPPKAWITAHCRLGGGAGGMVCCEQIAFELCANSSDQLRNLVFAHLDSDLPLVFWWRGILSDNFEPRLFSRFDRLLIDSDSWADSAAGIARVHQAAADRHSHFVLHDLAWSRAHALRLAIADCFEDPVARASLNDLRSLGITHSAGHRSAASLLSEWFGGRLGWKKDRAIDFVAGGELPISAVRIDCGDCQFEILVDAESGTVRARSELGGRIVQQVLPAGPPGDAELVSELLARGGKNELYLQASAPSAC